MTAATKITASVLSALLVLAPGTFARAGNDPPDRTTSAPHSSVTLTASKQQTQFERNKTALITRVQQGIDKANEDIDSLGKLADGEKGFAKDRIHHMQKALTFMRDLLDQDCDAITSATPGDWNDLHAMVESDLSGASTEVKLAYAVIKTPRPATGVTNKQPQTK